MNKIWILGLVIFILVTFIVLRITKKYYKKNTSAKMRKMWGSTIYYWEGTIMISSAFTFLVLYLLKWSNIVDF